MHAGEFELRLVTKAAGAVIEAALPQQSEPRVPKSAGPASTPHEVGRLGGVPAAS